MANGIEKIERSESLIAEQDVRVQQVKAQTIKNEETQQPELQSKALVSEVKTEWITCNEVEETYNPKFQNGLTLLHSINSEVQGEYRYIDVKEINPETYKRSGLTGDFKDCIIESMGESGQIVPVGVERAKTGKYKYNLLFGKKRVVAAINSGLTLIHALEFISEDPKKIRLLQINEAVIKSELSSSQRAKLLNEKWQIIDATTNGVGNEQGDELPEKSNDVKQGDNDEMISRRKKYSIFIKEAADLTGKTPRTIEQDLQIERDITEENHKLLEGSFLEDNKSEKLMLARLKDPELQTKVLKAVLEQKVKKVKDAIAMFAEDLITKPAVYNPDMRDTQLRINLKLAKHKIKTLESKTQELGNKVKLLEVEVNTLRQMQISDIPEFDLYPYTELNKQVIQIEGGQDE